MPSRGDGAVFEAQHPHSVLHSLHPGERLHHQEPEAVVDHLPERLAEVDAGEHGVAGEAVILPVLLGGIVDGRNLPLFQRVLAAVVEPEGSASRAAVDSSIAIFADITLITLHTRGN